MGRRRAGRGFDPAGCHLPAAEPGVGRRRAGGKGGGWPLRRGPGASEFGRGPHREVDGRGREWVSVRPRARPDPTVPVVVGVLAALFVGVAAWNWVDLCYFAVYNCPSNGCDGIPQHNCEVGWWSFVVVGIAGAATLAVVLLWWRRRNRRIPG